MLDLPSLTNLEAEPVDVATIPTSDAAAADWASSPNSIVRTGMKIMPPPNPNKAPMAPAPTAIVRSANNNRGSIRRLETDDIIKRFPIERRMTVLLVRYSEIGLKSTPVRIRFESRLRDNMIDMLARDGVEAIVTKERSRFFVESSDMERAICSLRRVFGIASFSITEMCGPDLDSICAAAAEYSKGRMVKGKTFAVKARREGNQKFTSMDVGRKAGDAIWNSNLNLEPAVDLKNPDVTFYIEARPKSAYLFDEYVRCHGGLPVGTQGRIVCDVDDDRGVLSAWLMMKRGCRAYVRGTGDLDVLRAYDPQLKVIEPGDWVERNLGYVKGWSVDDIEGFDPKDYALPVYFPTVGMTDEEVAKRMSAIRAEIEATKPSLRFVSPFRL